MTIKNNRGIGLKEEYIMIRWNAYIIRRAIFDLGEL